MHLNKKYISLWIICLCILIVSNGISYNSLISYNVPLIVVISFILIFNKLNLHRLSFLPYVLFFSISVLTFFGYAETLTGSHAESSNIFLFGLSFYTASLAFLIGSNKNLSYGDSFKISNPLLLITGPMALFVKPISMNFLKRVNYYLPFVIIGIFFFRVIAMPLTDFFFLINYTDAASAIVFAIIFEIFVYTNFAGLSLLIYGIFGILGYKIPLNFKQPFSSSNIIDFWKGWHTSLSAVLKALFYKPVRKRYSTFYAVLIVYIASAFWHGVTINFLIWGIFHALMFWVTIKALNNNFKILPIILLFIGVVIGRLIFADNNTERLLEKLTFSYEGTSKLIPLLDLPSTSIMSLILAITLIAIEFFFKKNKFVRKRNYKHLRTPFALFIIVFLGLFFISNMEFGYAVYGQR